MLKVLTVGVELRRTYRFVLNVAGFVILGGISFLAGAYDRFPGDLEVSRWVQSLRTPWLDTLMGNISIFGSFIPSIIGVLLVAGLLIWARKPEAAVLLLTATTMGSLINWALKLAIARPRPSSTLVAISSISQGVGFPSGHAMFMMIFFGILIFLVSIYVQGNFLRWGMMSLLAALIPIIGLSRIYLGAHWLSDVLGGYVFGLTLLFVSIRVYQHWRYGNRKRRLEI